jgi:ATP-dependent DNA helicase RecG
VTIEAKVGRHKPPPPFNKKLPYRVEVSDPTGTLTLVFFHAFADSLKRSLPEGETRFISGEISWYGSEPQIAHPDHILTADEFSHMPLIEPVYPLTAGLSPKILGRAIRAALGRLPDLAEWQDAAWKQQQHWPRLFRPRSRRCTIRQITRHRRSPRQHRCSPMMSCRIISWR